MAKKKNVPFFLSGTFWNKSQKYVQFSKRMAMIVTIFWMVYRIAQFVVVLVRPEVSSDMAELVKGVDAAQMANMGWYTGNSSVEKIALAFSNNKEKEEETEETGYIE